MKTQPSDAPERRRTSCPHPGWTAIVLAGRRPGVDPLAEHFGVESKALIEVDGQPMLGRVLRTLVDSPEIERVFILAQDVEDIMADPRLLWAREEPSIVGLQSGSGISRSVQAAVTEKAGSWPVLVTTADNALLTPEMVAHFVGEAGQCDLAVGLVSRSELLRSFPDAKRSWLKFRGEAYTGANLFALNSDDAVRVLEMWQQVESDRKSLFKVAAHFGPWLLLCVALRIFSMREAIMRAGLRLDLLAKPVVLPFAEAGIDVDKPSDHMLAEQILRARRAKAA